MLHCNIAILQLCNFSTLLIYNIAILQLCNIATCSFQLYNIAGRTSWTDQLDGSAGQTSWTDQLDRPAGRTSWTDQLDGPWPWPVRIFEDFRFSLFIVAASESNEVLVLLLISWLERSFKGTSLASILWNFMTLVTLVYFYLRKAAQELMVSLSVCAMPKFSYIFSAIIELSSAISYLQQQKNLHSAIYKMQDSIYHLQNTIFKL